MKQTLPLGFVSCDPCSKINTAFTLVHVSTGRLMQLNNHYFMRTEIFYILPKIGLELQF